MAFLDLVSELFQNYIRTADFIKGNEDSFDPSHIIDMSDAAFKDFFNRFFKCDPNSKEIKMVNNQMFQRFIELTRTNHKQLSEENRIIIDHFKAAIKSIQIDVNCALGKDILKVQTLETKNQTSQDKLCPNHVPEVTQCDLPDSEIQAAFDDSQAKPIAVTQDPASKERQFKYILLPPLNPRILSFSSIAPVDKIIDKQQ